MVLGIVVLVVLLALVAWFVSGYNSLVKARNQVKNAWSQIDVQLKRRHDLIPNLVEVVKDYMSYEQETLEAVVQARGAAVRAKGVHDVAAAEQALTGALGNLFALMENYPDLKANQNVSELQEELTSTENRVAFSRQHYNDAATAYQNKRQMIPTNIIAGMFNFAEEELWEIEDSAERAVPKVDLRG